MAEYWKSTPKYWCKFCQQYVRDTKLEKQNHEATARHQSSIQKSLRDLHRGKEREEREKQRAKDEVARLNGVVGSKPAIAGASGSGTVAKPSPVFTKDAPKKATAEDRKRQMAQLAAMGIAIPDEYRRDMAMASEWQTVATEPAVHGSIDPTNPNAIVKGVRKRAHAGDEDEEEQDRKPRKGWGSQTKTYSAKSADVDFDKLLKEPIKLKQSDIQQEKDEEIKTEENPEGLPIAASPPKAEDIPLKPEDETPDAPVVFKKRKKPIREK